MLSIVIVNWNTGRLLNQCLNSIASTIDDISFEIVIIDNASSDDSLASLDAEQLFGNRLRLIRNEDNVGFARANNQGIAVTSGESIFLLNPDTEVKNGAIGTLINTIQEDPEIGACAPRLLNSDGTTQPSVWRSMPWAWYPIFEGLGLYKCLPKRMRGEFLLGRHWQYDRKRTVQGFSGAAFVVRRRLVKEIGAFDEKFHMYGEDIEWCHRMTTSNWKLVFNPVAEVVHHGGCSAAHRWSAGESRLQQVEAMCRFQCEHLSWLQATTNMLATISVRSILKFRRAVLGRATRDLDEVIAIEWKHLKKLLLRQGK